jgi:two-component system, NarL family, nitrate/nitrite response regulator NarL
VTQPAGAVHAGTRRLTVALVEDHALFREGLRMVLEAATGIEIVGEAEGAADAFEVVERGHPEVVLVDVTLRDANGIALLRSLVDRYPTIRFLVLSMHRDPETVRRAFMAGAAGYVIKSARAPELVEAIRAVARGDQYVHSGVAAAIVSDSLRWQRSGLLVTAREREILALVSAGKHAPDIARLLGISEHTVRRHIANLCEKLGIHGIAGLREYAVQHGQLEELP